MATTDSPASTSRRLKFTHDHWMASLGLPLHTGYYIPDLRTLELGWWPARGCETAFIQLEGQQGITETRVSEVPAQAVLPPVRLALDRLNLRRLSRVVERESPDAVVCTHFLPVEALSHIRGRGRLRVPLHCVITDFGAHPFWAFPHVDRYFVATDETARELAALGVPRAFSEAAGSTIAPIEAHIRFLKEARPGAALVMHGGVVKLGESDATICLDMRHADGAHLLEYAAGDELVTLV